MYQTSAPVRYCTDFRADAFIQAAMQVIDAKTKEPLDGHEMLDVLADVEGTGFTDPLDRMWYLNWDLLIYNMTFIEIIRSSRSGLPLKFMRLEPEFMAIEMCANYEHRYYYRPLNSAQWWEIDRKNMIIISSARVDPTTPFGVPRLASLIKETTLDSDLVGQLQLMIQNRLMPSWVLEHQPGSDKYVDPARLTEVKRIFEKYAAGDKTGGVAVVPGGLHANVIGMKWSDLAVNQVLAVPEQRVHAAFGVPPSLIGKAGAQGETTRTNAAEARKMFWESVMIPWFSKIGASLTTQMLRQWPRTENLAVHFDVSDIPAIREHKINQLATITPSFASGLISRSEAQRLAGVPIHGSDVFYRPTSVGAVIDGEELDSITSVDADEI
jgi:hypothetical protein